MQSDPHTVPLIAMTHIVNQVLVPGPLSAERLARLLADQGRNSHKSAL